MNPVLVDTQMNTPYGLGRDVCWRNLLAGATAIRAVARFAGGAFLSDQAALAPVRAENQRSRVLSLLWPALEAVARSVPADAAVLLATTTGEIDLLERAVDGESVDGNASHPARLLATVKQLVGARGPGLVVSSACASSAVAVARGRRDAAHRARPGRTGRGMRCGE